MEEQDSKSLPHAEVIKTCLKVKQIDSTWSAPTIRQHQLPVWGEMYLLSTEGKPPMNFLNSAPKTIIYFQPFSFLPGWLLVQTWE